MSSQFQHILVPLDFTPKNQAALDVAFELASLNKARVTFLHVIETIEYVAPEELGAFYQQLTARAEAQMKATCERFIAAEIPIEWAIHYGKRLTQIVQGAQSHHADLIVMSSHKIDPAALPHSFGTLSYQVSILCDCPVLLVK